MAAVSLSVSTVKPLGDRIFIKVSESEEKTAGGSSSSRLKEKSQDAQRDAARLKPRKHTTAPLHPVTPPLPCSVTRPAGWLWSREARP